MIANVLPLKALCIGDIKTNEAPLENFYSPLWKKRRPALLLLSTTHTEPKQLMDELIIPSIAMDCHVVCDRVLYTEAKDPKVEEIEGVMQVLQSSPIAYKKGYIHPCKKCSHCWIVYKTGKVHRACPHKAERLI